MSYRIPTKSLCALVFVFYSTGFSSATTIQSNAIGAVQSNTPWSDNDNNVSDKLGTVSASVGHVDASTSSDARVSTSVSNSNKFAPIESNMIAELNVDDFFGIGFAGASSFVSMPFVVSGNGESGLSISLSGMWDAIGHPDKPFSAALGFRASYELRSKYGTFGAYLALNTTALGSYFTRSYDPSSASGVRVEIGTVDLLDWSGSIGESFSFNKRFYDGETGTLEAKFGVSIQNSNGTVNFANTFLADFQLAEGISVDLGDGLLISGTPPLGEVPLPATSLLLTSTLAPFFMRKKRRKKTART